MGDFNAHRDAPNGVFEQFVKDLNLTDVMDVVKDDSKKVPTYTCGSNRVDYMLLLADLLSHVTASDYDAFNKNIYSDHRLTFVDIDHNVFPRETPDSAEVLNKKM